MWTWANSLPSRTYAHTGEAHKVSFSESSSPVCMLSTLTLQIQFLGSVLDIRAKIPQSNFLSWECGPRLERQPLVVASLLSCRVATILESHVHENTENKATDTQKKSKDNFLHSSHIVGSQFSSFLQDWFNCGSGCFMNCPLSCNKCACLFNLVEVFFHLKKSDIKMYLEVKM